MNLTYVELMGLPGSGKSTLARLACEPGTGVLLGRRPHPASALRNPLFLAAVFLRLSELRDSIPVRSLLKLAIEFAHRPSTSTVLEQGPVQRTIAYSYRFGVDKDLAARTICSALSAAPLRHLVYVEVPREVAYRRLSERGHRTGTFAAYDGYASLRALAWHEAVLEQIAQTTTRVCLRISGEDENGASWMWIQDRLAGRDAS